MRSNGEPTPLPDGNAPAVSAASGLGTGGGAGVFTPIGSGWGNVECQIGASPSASGSVTLVFPSAPPAMFVSGDMSFGTVTGSLVGSTLTISWSGGNLKPGSRPKLHYEWNTSS